VIEMNEILLEILAFFLIIIKYGLVFLVLCLIGTFGPSFIKTIVQSIVGADQIINEQKKLNKKIDNVIDELKRLNT
jgi:hypothetical protein